MSASLFGTRAAVAIVLSLTLLVSACGGGISPRSWDSAIRGAATVERLLRDGDYAAAKARWQDVDAVIHRAYPLVHERDPELAANLWHEMAVVELGFLDGAWQDAQAAAGRLPELLTEARAALGGGDGR